jgi:hypothetical protein
MKIQKRDNIAWAQSSKSGLSRCLQFRPHIVSYSIPPPPRKQSCVALPQTNHATHTERHKLAMCADGVCERDMGMGVSRAVVLVCEGLPGVPHV